LHGASGVVEAVGQRQVSGPGDIDFGKDRDERPFRNTQEEIAASQPVISQKAAEYPRSGML